jgi:hypothetical protein
MSRRCLRHSARAGAVAAALLLAPRLAAGQEFAAAAPLPAESQARLLEHGLPPAAPGARFESIAIQWFGLSELGTASAVLGGGWRGGRAALGLSHTGRGELSWSAAALAGGWTDGHTGAALRGVARVRQGENGAPLPGAEAGAGAWADAGDRLRLWASAPQLWLDGEAPPLERRLELGASLHAGELELWLARRSAPGSSGGLRGEHSAGLTARAGALTLWTHLEDAPARGGFGLAVIWRGLGLSFASDLHPVLGETLAFGLTAGAR